ncbi:MAG: Bax inhibitor-1/YccA family protein [Pseudomonadota bacterium]
MNDFNRQYGATAPGRAMDTSTDAGLRAFMLGVYSKLAIGIALAGGLAFAAGTYEPLTQLVFGTPLRFVVQFGPIGLILFSAFAMRRPSPLGSAVLYWSVVTLMGLGLGVWVFAATNGVTLSSRGGRIMSPEMLTIAKAFFVTASAFGALSLFGYTTKTNLRPMGVFMVMALWGVIGISVISLFFPASSMLENIIMGAVLLLSAGLIAWETQELKEGYYQFAGDQRSMAVMTNWGALNFFILFYNMFQIILSFMSSD